MAPTARLAASMPDPKPSASAAHPPIRRSLPQGSVLWHRFMPHAPGISFGVFVHRGTRDETPEVAGISHLLEHMLFKGSSSRDAFELARDIEALGAQLDAYTTKEFTAYTLKCLPEVFRPAAEILREMLCDSVFPQDQLELEKSVVIDEIKGSEDTPDDHVHELFCSELFGPHPLGRPILGTVESVRGIDRQKLLDWCDRAHRGGNVILSLAGAVSDLAVDAVTALFDFPAGNAVRAQPKIEFGRAARRANERRLEQQYVELGTLCGGALAPERYAIGILANLLGGGMSSRIFQRVREREGLAYSIYCYGDSFADVGIFGTSYASTAANAPRVLEIIGEEYARLCRGELAAEELESNRTQLLAAIVLGMEGSGSQMTRMARSEMLYGRYLRTEEIVAGVRAVRLEDVLTVARELLDPARQTLVTHGPNGGLAFP